MSIKHYFYVFHTIYSRREEIGLQDILSDIEEVMEAAQGLKEVSKVIEDLCSLTQSALKTTLTLSETDMASVRAGFSCLICKGLYLLIIIWFDDASVSSQCKGIFLFKGPLNKPIFATCCRSIICCSGCIVEWKRSHNYCPKCRAEDLDRSIHEVAGLEQALAPLEKLF